MNLQAPLPLTRDLRLAPADDDALLRKVKVFADILSNAAEDADASAVIAPETWRALQSSGLALAPFPVRYGGADLTATHNHRLLFDVLRRIGAADLSMARLFEGHVNAVALVCRYGSDAQVGDLARAVADGAVSAVWGADDATGLKLQPCGARKCLHGRKMWASGAGIVTHPVVTAKSQAGQVMVLPRLRPGERADLGGWTAQGMRSTATGTIDLSEMELDADQILGMPGDFMRQPSFSGGAWRFCAVHLGAAERLVDLFRDHLTSRGRADDPYQMQRVAQCVAATTTAAFWVGDAARRLAEAVDDPQEIVAFVNLTRMVTERAALDVIEAVHRGVGLNGFLRAHPIERISRDLATYLRQPVPDLAMADAARTILKSDRPIAAFWTAHHEG